jgi:hypothetical protein
MAQEEKKDPQVVVPRDLHKILLDRSKRSGLSLQRLVADVLRSGMVRRGWMPEEVEN